MVNFTTRLVVMVGNHSETDLSTESIGRLADLVEILSAESNVLVRYGPLRTQGRMTFGREYAGAEGIGLFILMHEAENDASE